MDDNDVFSMKREEPDLNDGLNGFEVPPEVIKVVGVGGAGGNALNTIIRSGTDDVDFIAANTDVAALKHSEAPVRLILGKSLTKGRGAGANPEVGQKAAEESEEELTSKLAGADMVFITAGMGGGTGTGAAPVVAGVAKEKIGALVIGIVTKPFSWEGPQRIQAALEGIQRLREKVDALIVVENDRIIELSDKSTSTRDAYTMSDEVLRQAVTGVSGVIRKVMQINVDFADIRTVMQNSGTAIMGVGEAKADGKTEGRVMAAARAAMTGPLMSSPMNGASSVLYTIQSGEDIPILEVNEAAKLIAASARKDARIIWGQDVDPSLGDTVRFTLIATGFKEDQDVNADAGDGMAASNLFNKTPLTPGDVVSDGVGSIFDDMGFGKGLDIPAAVHRPRKKS